MRTIPNVSEVVANMDTIRLVKLVADLGGPDDPAGELVLGHVAAYCPERYSALVGSLQREGKL